MAEFPVYECHKRVRAAKISDPLLRIHGTGKPQIEVEIDGQRQLADVPANIWARGEAMRGDYLVIYDDGYTSWSPRGAFEAGYHLAEKVDG